MAARWSILYRGPLSSCNYACDYCPFAKTKNTRQELQRDARQLARFVGWVGEQGHKQVGVLFTPWGEALIRRHYQEAFAALSQMEHVARVCAQTNLSCRLDWLDACRAERVALWCTFHPTETDLESFVARSFALHRRGIRHSVGIVGLKQHFAQIEALRHALHPDVYLWINAYKRQPDYYSPEEGEWLASIDEHFPTNTRYHESLGHGCRAGHLAFTVDGRGDARRCHFIPQVLGNIYQPGFDSCLQRRPCTHQSCGCHIGYVHMDRLGLYETYGEGILERIPTTWSR